MEYQKILDDTTNQPSKFIARNWFEANDESKGEYDNSNIRFNLSMIRSSLCDYSDAYMLVKGTVTIPNATAAGVAVNNTNKKVIFKNYAPCTNCITEINNTPVDDVQKIDIVTSMYNLVEHSNAYLNTSGSLRQYYRDEPDIDAKGNIIYFPHNINSKSFKFKQQMTG